MGKFPPLLLNTERTMEFLIHSLRKYQKISHQFFSRGRGDESLLAFFIAMHQEPRTVPGHILSVQEMIENRMKSSKDELLG